MRCTGNRRATQRSDSRSNHNVCTMLGPITSRGARLLRGVGTQGTIRPISTSTSKRTHVANTNASTPRRSTSKHARTGALPSLHLGHDGTLVGPVEHLPVRWSCCAWPYSTSTQREPITWYGARFSTTRPARSAIQSSRASHHNLCTSCLVEQVLAWTSLTCLDQKAHCGIGLKRFGLKRSLPLGPSSLDPLPRPSKILRFVLFFPLLPHFHSGGSFRGIVTAGCAMDHQNCGAFHFV